jgi:hypothetical protein
MRGVEWDEEAVRRDGTLREASLQVGILPPILRSIFGPLLDHFWPKSCLYTSVCCVPRLDFGRVFDRSFIPVRDTISVSSYFLTPTYEILPVPYPNRTVA